MVGGVSGIYNQRECFYGLLRNGYVAYLRKLASSTKPLFASKILPRVASISNPIHILILLKQFISQDTQVNLAKKTLSDFIALIFPLC